jgi:hypothetical protein
MTEEAMEWLATLEADLRQKKDRTDSLDDLFQLSFIGGQEELEKVSWCLAKMAQNKCQDMRVYTILMSMYDVVNDDVAENVAWGLGELAGVGIGSYEALSALRSLMDSSVSTVRSSAAWAVGRYNHRLHLTDPESSAKLEQLLDDPSELVRKSARFAIDDE